ncbi:uncharacterized protein LOC109846687 [Asparagus officinalis]|uniref:uncharacterized protein LOC109846687 n=1 Tax=Asparagus officinalis TaxID=4686 RepID=UPI00098E1A6B|nr:uncharacterized protein LOC109846687 [Asparagus officinalis]
MSVVLVSWLRRRRREERGPGRAGGASARRSGRRARPLPVGAVEAVGGKDMSVVGREEAMRKGPLHRLSSACHLTPSARLADPHRGHRLLHPLPQARDLRPPEPPPTIPAPPITSASLSPIFRRFHWAGSTLYSPFYTEVGEEGHPIEFSQSATQQVSSQETPTTKKKKAYTRSENWTVHEDKLLVSAWLNTSQDAIQGTGQHKDKFWHRANNYFIQYSVDPTSRTPNQMMHRWSTIQLSVNKFCGCVAQIEGRQRSGTGIIDQTAEVKELYQSLYGKPFVFDHCWVELRHHQKWSQQMENYNKIRSQPKETR